MFFSENGLETNLKIRILDENNKVLTQLEEFSDQDYFSFSSPGILTGLSTSMMNNIDKIGFFISAANLITHFNKLVSELKKSVEKLSIVQNITCVNNQLISKFIPDYNKLKDETKIPCDDKCLTLEEKDYYQKMMIQSEGKEPTLYEAKKLFDEISAHKDIPFAYTDDGCYARAHIIANWLHNEGYRSGKIWLKGHLTPPNNPNKTSDRWESLGKTWEYHVAAIIFVKNEENKSEIMVIDPAPNNKKLLTMDEWFSFNNLSSDINPKIIQYPLPKSIEPFEKFVYALSSHVPLWPSETNLNLSPSETLNIALSEASKYMRKLLEQP
ncbi:MAG: hypothetical protein H6731_02445 [Myxococcales bacterium]|nr:MAG: hypothetical protein H6731_02445 [Myxococcales bacterium]